MDLQKIIVELREERRKVGEAISVLEALGNAPANTGGSQSFARHRGRRLMSPEERRSVSERMKKYWAGRQRAPELGMASRP